ncbi:ABC transporter permease [Nocardioides guangzhouensis]|uniref:ABC transporter permease n=1 Tax=Nocardioides guangzhouensis TaxID=2497878 RepID=A0A4Q4ZJN2_9ACTN|nr:ABC transporter permease [Nocardioides guangzhouensis]RYP87726.1 ABC transporter permease [Nocardioides guangzhouensis]
MTTKALDPVRVQASARQVSLSRVTYVELGKMFDTRSGFWLMSSIVIAALLSTVATILFAPDAELTFYTFAEAIGFPMTVILPIIALLSITSEWTQRSGLTTFTLVPHRNWVILAKVIASVAVGVVSMLVALAIGVVGNLVGTAITRTDRVWDVSVAHFLLIVLGSLLCLLTGTTFGILFRSTPVALVAYFVYSLVLPTLFGILASSQERFLELQPWVDASNAQAPLFDGSIAGDQWAHLAATAVAWLLLPALVGLRLIARSEVR